MLRNSRLIIFAGSKVKWTVNENRLLQAARLSQPPKKMIFQKKINPLPFLLSYLGSCKKNKLKNAHEHHLNINPNTCFLPPSLATCCLLCMYICVTPYARSITRFLLSFFLSPLYMNMIMWNILEYADYLYCTYSNSECKIRSYVIANRS